MADGRDIERWRASDDDRRRVADLLVEHAADGRLTLVELEERLTQVHASRYRDEVGDALRELPVLRARADGGRRSSAQRRRLPPVVALVAAGGILLGSTVFRGETHYLSSSGPVVASSPPPAPPPGLLPPPGPEQPADPIAARAGVEQAYRDAFEPVADPAAKESAVLRTPALREAGALVARQFPEAVATTTVVVGGVVFTSPTDAVLEFQLRYTGGVPIGWRRGTATFVDGRWRVSTESFCEVMRFAGATC